MDRNIPHGWDWGRRGSGLARGGSSHGSADGLSDPFEKVLTKEEGKQLMHSGKQEEAPHFLFVMDDILENKLSALDYAISTGAYTREDAEQQGAEMLASWDHKDRKLGYPLYTVLLK